ncbi:plasmid partitioning protein RepB [Shinella sp. HZN7]|jgi:ParB family chromosome partitioning protein|uniref:plasmid partitioning protein RepB n=1 Tax=Shinella sp. (strain HZN7) TaxID=879274 RepID=UPI0007DA71EB|nr:plasmid partitioning protein RepB [Shinella sp. HZN7]ANH08744.1 plasmid partitioning protein RepB [Shinella sp. HZN7]
MSKRRDALAGFLSPIEPTAEGVVRTKPVVQSGALNSMNQAIANLATEAEEAERLREQLEAGETIVEIDPTVIERSFIRDRLGGFTGPEFDAFREGIRSAGQIIPVLVRPHPQRPGEYQLAFGHRRVEASRQLGRNVKAIVRNLSDDDLVLAQGKENSDREDLSFIEKAFFALRLEQKGIRRQVTMDALAITSKGVLSGMISLASALPSELIEAIGPAKSIGRPRWEAFTELVRNDQSRGVWRNLIEEKSFNALTSDIRFEKLFKALSHRNETTKDEQIIHSAEGKRIATAQTGKRAVKLTIPTKDTPEFAAFLLSRLPEIYSAFVAQNGDAKDQKT